MVPRAAVGIVNRAREYKNGVRPGYVWEGIYPSFQDVPVSGGGFNGEVWLEARRHISEMRLKGDRDEQPKIFVDENLLLPFLVSIVGARGGAVGILDFGGGLGESYLDIRASLPQPCSIRYHVVETPAMCAEGSAIFAGDSQIKFHPELPSELETPDVVYVSSALQYVEDYAATLKQLCAYGAPFILFAKLSAGDIPTYATAQKNVRGSTMPYWFINLREMTEIMAAQGYKLISRSFISREYDQNNFPEQYRFKHACNLLFASDGSNKLT